MKYKLIGIADLHWGAMDSQLLFDHLEIFLEFIRQSTDEIDIVVIVGDYFDYRLQLNSKTAIHSIEWFDKFVNVCKESHVKKIRIVKGTKEHDNDQLEVFRSMYELEDGYLKIFNTTVFEETLPGLKCIYCPDEPINLREYDSLYYKEWNNYPDIAFIHGNFSNVLPEIEYNRIQSHNLPTMIYQYNKFAKFIKGPIIAGHWHIGQECDSLYYIGSYDRWKFGEEEDKGFLYCEMDTDSGEYYIHRIVNPLAYKYKTFIISNENYFSPESFAELSAIINNELNNDMTMKLKISYLISTESQESLVNFNNFQKSYITNRQVKIDVKDLIKREAKKEKKQAVSFEASKYQYIFDKNAKIPNIIQHFIKDKHSVEIPLETIHKYVDKYI